MQREGIVPVTLNKWTYEFLYKSDFKQVVDRLILNNINFECTFMSSPAYYILKIKGKKSQDVKLLLRSILNAQEEKS